MTTLGFRRRKPTIPADPRGGLSDYEGSCCGQVHDLQASAVRVGIESVYDFDRCEGTIGIDLRDPSSTKPTLWTWS